MFWGKEESEIKNLFLHGPKTELNHCGRRERVPGSLAPAEP